MPEDEEKMKKAKQILQIVEETFSNLKQWAIEMLKDSGRIMPTVFTDKDLIVLSSENMKDEIKKIDSENKVWFMASEILSSDEKVPTENSEQLLLKGRAKRFIAMLVVFYDIAFFRVYEIIYSGDLIDLRPESNLALDRKTMLQKILS